MSSRINYANAAAVLTDFIRESESMVPGSVGDDAAIDFIVQWVGNGGSMVGLCDQYGLQWGVLAAWIRKDATRNDRYMQAMADRGMIRKERLLDGWWDTATREVERAVEHGDVHKAREALAKAEGMFKVEGGGKGGSITITFDDVDARA